MIHWLGNASLTEVWLGRLVDGIATYVLIPAWTLCYEEQFYLICGLTLCFARSRIFAVFLAISLLVIPISLAFWFTNGKAHGFFFDGLWLQFALGLFVYYYRMHASRQAGNLGLSVLGFFLGLAILFRLLTCPDIVNGLSRLRYFDSTVFSILFAFTLIALQRWDKPIATSCIMRPLMACGTMCYSLYLTHLPVISCMRKHAYRPFPEPPLMHWLDAVLTFAATIVGGALFFYLVERRFLNKASAFPILIPSGEGIGNRLSERN
jgi:peptidoglycan/LPS O-acetylase OafA/YrhL